MKKKIIIFFSILMFIICFLIISLENNSNLSSTANAANFQQSYNLKIANVRGNIYDCNFVSMVNKKKKIVASIIPSIETLNKISEVMPENKNINLLEIFSGNMPFILEITKKVKSKDIECFEIPIRYSGITRASHIIGYLSGDQKGVSGIEKSFDEYLHDKDDDINIKYIRTASNKLLMGGKNNIKNKNYKYSKGVVLNIDSKIQNIVEEVAGKYISDGVVIISEVPNCEIRAWASLPNFQPQNVAEYLSDKKSPLLNKGLCQFDLGSIFKLVTAATALENNINGNVSFECKGAYKVENHNFRCYNGVPHGVTNMEKAIAYSCNGYFIKITENIDPNLLLEMSRKFGLGKSINLAPCINSAEGILPENIEKTNKKLTANISFGQGKLSVSPIQVVGLINSIASDGKYSVPKLVKGLVDSGLNFVLQNENEESEQIISSQTAEKLKKYMNSSIEFGTSKRGKPTKVTALAKTSTAQTGMIKDGEKVIQSWFAGSIPYENPKYNIVILSEDTLSGGGGKTCGPVFSEIADKIYSLKQF
ncbi:MAG: penicillin-binding protein 2 [Candidatus Paraimprobicoccus trichonymphae]|uniref:Penicillin-binding protein 2 n=1 Tax=Candidatus Paraimprobicoccus trichonymphae TaxID=3033793 RepID=A0AA48KYY1_9FIRM|nr:MAG: penicillin-binding protein 2 [Candidatus Paraimprobicoccus trichonymphae]